MQSIVQSRDPGIELRLPAEWEKQRAVLLAWPHRQTEWAPKLDNARRNIGEIISSILPFEPVILAVPGHEEEKLVRKLFPDTNLRVHIVESNDIWARDFGPLTVFDNQETVFLDFIFNAWGRKYRHDKDSLITRTLFEQNAFGTGKIRCIDFVLEGGSIESDGKGRIMTTSQCLLNPNRNPDYSRQGIEAVFRNSLGSKNILWLDYGYLEGDDTDSHIDTLARFAPDDTILYVRCDDPHDRHFAELRKMEEQLQNFRTEDGRKYCLLPLPWPSPKFDGEGRRMPATYANFLVINGAVLVPTYRDKMDPLALETISDAFKGREIRSVDCSTLIEKHGSLHCVTMQIPSQDIY